MKRRIRLVLCLLAAFVTAAPLCVSDGSLLQAAPKQKKKQNKKQAARKKAKQQAAAKQKLAKQRANARKKEANRRPNTNTPPKKPATTTTPKPKSPPETSSKIQVDIRNWKETEKLIGDQKGKIVVVAVWASSCEGCVKEFPNLVALQSRFPKDVATVSFNVDNIGDADSAPEKNRPQILKLLTKFNAKDVRNILSKDSDEAVYKELKIDSAPTILVYGRDGKLAKKIDLNSTGGKDISYDKHITPFVEGLLKSK